MIIAHRGYSYGATENTIQALQKSSKLNISGIEIDIREKDGNIILSHDPVVYDKEYIKLKDVIEFAKKQDWILMIEFKEYSDKFYKKVKDILKNYDKNKIYFFAFFDIAKNFPWKNENDVNLGIIVKYPWQINYVIQKYKPKMIAFGWDYRKWTRIAFKIYWSIFSFSKIKNKFNINTFTGIAQNKNDILFLEKMGSDFISVDFNKKLVDMYKKNM